VHLERRLLHGWREEERKRPFVHFGPPLGRSFQPRDLLFGKLHLCASAEKGLGRFPPTPGIRVTLHRYLFYYTVRSYGAY